MKQKTKQNMKKKRKEKKKKRTLGKTPLRKHPGKFTEGEVPWNTEVIMQYSSNWIMLLLPCTCIPLGLCCDWFDHGSRQEV